MERCSFFLNKISLPLWIYKTGLIFSSHNILVLFYDIICFPWHGAGLACHGKEKGYKECA